MGFFARVHERKTRDFNQVKCIKDEREHLLVKEDEIRHRWQEYFDKLFNGENTDTTFLLDGTGWYPNRGVEMPWGHSYTMANQAV